MVNVVLITLQNNPFLNKKDNQDLVDLLTQSPNDLQLIQAMFDGDIIHIVSDSFNDVAPPTHLYFVNMKDYLSKKLEKVNKADRTIGALQIWLLTELFKQEGYPIDSIRQFATTLINASPMQVCMEIPEYHLNKHLDIVLNGKW